VLSSLDVRAETSEATHGDDDVAQLPHRINETFHTVTGGTRQTTFKGIALGDGRGMNATRAETSSNFAVLWSRTMTRSSCGALTVI
jgi:hypothetical protein